VDGCASLSPDGRTIGFTSNRTGDFDIYLATRSDAQSGFGNVTRLPAPVNGPATDSCPTLLQGHRMIFTSTRDDPAGDMYETRRGPNGWSAPRRLGPNINLPGIQEESAAVYEDSKGREVIMFSRRNGSDPGKIYESIDGAPATLVAGGPHSSAADNRPSVTHDGLTIFWDSTRAGSQAEDIYYATRSSTSQPFGPAIHLQSLSGDSFDARPFISWDGSMLTFSSIRAGNPSPAPDIWFATRSRANGR
jgi:Tol biopolymer transport system component